MPKVKKVAPTVKAEDVELVECPQCHGKGTCTLCGDTGKVDKVTAELNSKE